MPPTARDLVAYVGGGGYATAEARLPWIVVASAFAPAKLRALADYLCDGTADEVEINAALALTDPRPVLLAGGQFNTSAPIAFVDGRKHDLIATAADGTPIVADHAGNVIEIHSASLPMEWRIRLVNLYVTKGATLTPARGFSVVNGSYITFENCRSTLCGTNFYCSFGLLNSWYDCTATGGVNGWHFVGTSGQASNHNRLYDCAYRTCEVGLLLGSFAENTIVHGGNFEPTDDTDVAIRVASGSVSNDNLHVHDSWFEGLGDFFDFPAGRNIRIHRPYLVKTTTDPFLRTTGFAATEVVIEDPFPHDWRGFDALPAAVTLSRGKTAVAHVDAFGAKGNDAVEDSRAFVRALTWLKARGGGELVLGAKSYILAQQGTVTADFITTPYCLLIDHTYPAITIRGEGMGVSTLKLDTAAPADCSLILVRGEPTTRRTNPTLLRDFTVDGQGDANLTDSVDFGMVTAIRCDRFQADRIEFKNCPDSTAGGDYASLLIFRDSRDFDVRRCVFRQRLGQGGMCRIESGPGSACDNDLIGLADGAEDQELMAISANTDISVVSEQVSLERNRFVGGQTQLAVAGTRRCRIVGNSFRDLVHTSGQSIYITGSNLNGGWYNDDLLIAGNAFDDVRFPVRIANGGAGYGVRRTQVVRNAYVDGPGAIGGPFVTELGSTSVEDTICQDNTIVGASSPFALAAASSLAALKGNRVYGATNVLTARDENRGTATVAAAASSAVVTHGLGRTPGVDEIAVLPGGDIAPATYWWVDTITSTQFTIRTNAGVTAATTFGWRVARG